MRKSFLTCMGLLSAAALLVCGVDPCRAFAASKTVPTCNGFDATGTIPQYIAPGATTGTPLCTDYFGSPNWANSPLPTGPIDITATGVTIVDGGSGYTAPVVTVTDYYSGVVANPAACSATMDDALGTVSGIPGSILTVTCSSGGSGYMAPVVTVTDGVGGPGTGAWVLGKLSAAGPFVGGLPKFVDALPDLKGAIAVADTATFPGSDYYEISLVQTTTQMHRDLPTTTVRGYVQVPSGSSNSQACSATSTFNYLGPVILAQRDRPVRVKFTNCLPTGAGGDLFIPTDHTYMGAGMGPDGTSYLDNRATLHLHGGVTPWISDGTPHQWTVPVGETTSLQKGASVMSVPDMYFVNGQVIPQCSATVTTRCSGGLPGQLPVGAVNDPGQGAISFYWTNQQSGRLMFYHDHALGTTRLNVYAGEAAGYLIYDPAEEAALYNLGVPGTITVNATQTAPDTAHLIPLVLQDKTFVPSASQLASQDPTWIWGTGAVAPAGNGNGDLWFPHVYLTNQNPSDVGGSNAFGRWDYGAWFYPAQTSLTAAGTGPLGPNTAVTIPCTSAAFPGQVLTPDASNNYLAGCPIIPNPSGTPEGFMDTPVVNGKAYPVLHVAPEAYRFQILAAGNDRSWNLQLYQADASGTEVAMVSAAPPSTGSILPLCKTVNPLTIPSLGIGIPSAILDTSGNPLNGTGLPANCWPNYGAPSPGIYSKQFMWAADGRDGGVPDPRFAGPPIIQIGTEGGLLPAPVVMPSTPTNYEVNVKSITVTNVSAHQLWLGPAERADAIIDFSKFAGKTLIMYNDAPTPAPAYDMRDDYYTGDVDLTSTGGAPSTVPGYGPNTRTVMQIKVDLGASVPAQTPFNVRKLINGVAATSTTPAIPGLSGIFKMTQPEIVVPEPSYTAASGGHAPTATYAKVQDSTITYQPAGLPAVASINITAGGTGYSAKTVVTIAAPTCVAGPSCFPATATATVTAGVVTAATVTNVGAGYTATPLVTITDPLGTGTGALAVASKFNMVTFDGKAIQELFTLDYGRMNATLGNELPLTNFLVQTTLPFGYAEWPTEIIQADKPQIWFLTHNGVDTHFIHFHLFNVQVINRVGWDGTVRPPEENELGWKDTVRMNQLENIIFAIKPITPVVPFPLPDSIRPMNPVLPVGVIDPGMSGIDPATGNAIVAAGGRTNSVVNFGHEYVWHCHILGHEENDMMRAMIYQVPPALPTSLVATGPSAAAPGVTLSWKDNSASETEFTVQRDAVPTFDSPALATFTVNGSSANTTGFSTLGYGQTVSLFDPTVTIGSTYYYRLLATDDFNQKSPLTAPFQTVAVSSPYTGSAAITVAPVAPTVTLTAPASAAFGSSFTVTATTNSGIAPTITKTGPCTIGPVGGSAANATATVTMTGGTGSCVLTANWAAHGIFTSATATKTTLATPATPTVTFTGAPASSISYFTVTATTNAAIKPTITGTAGVCSVGGVTGTSPATALVTMTSTTGICSLTANWATTANYIAASLTQTTSTPVVITTASLPGGTINVAYGPQALTATGSVQPYTWSMAGGALPTGLTLNAAGVISGTPTAAGTFNFRVRATAASTASPTAALSIVVAQTIPTAPTGLTLVMSGVTRIALTWTDNSNNEASFTVWRSVNGSAFAPVTVTRSSAQTTSVGGLVTYNDTTVVAGNTYAYFVTAVNTAGASAPTPTATMPFTLPAIPTLVSITAVKAGATDTATLTWTDVANEVSYYVQRANNAAFAGTLTNTSGIPANTTTFQQTLLAPATTYYYRVQAFNPLGGSGWSNIMSVTTP